jgi:hypothetical protein
MCTLKKMIDPNVLENPLLSKCYKCDGYDNSCMLYHQPNVKLTSYSLEDKIKSYKFMRKKNK